jgi:hypothetical protein
MPELFTRCVRRGGRVRIVKPKPNVYIKVCYPTDGGSPIHGEVHHTKEKPKGG